MDAETAEEKFSCRTYGCEEDSEVPLAPDAGDRCRGVVRWRKPVDRGTRDLDGSYAAGGSLLDPDTEEALTLCGSADLEMFAETEPLKPRIGFGREIQGQRPCGPVEQLASDVIDEHGYLYRTRVCRQNPRQLK